MSHTLAWIGLAAYGALYLARICEVATGAGWRDVNWRLPSEWISAFAGVYVLVLLVRVVA